jgi:hypothetical protein
MSAGAEFTGRVVGVWAKDPVQGGMLEGAHVRQLGSRTFVVGREAFPEDGPNPHTPLTYWFPVENILMLVVYPDLEAALAGSRQRSAGKAQKGTWWSWGK